MMSSILLIGDEFSALVEPLQNVLSTEEIQIHFLPTHETQLTNALETHQPMWAVVSEAFFNQAARLRPALVGAEKEQEAFEFLESKPQKPSFLKHKAQELSQKEHHHAHELPIVRELELLKKQALLERSNILIYFENPIDSSLMKTYFRAGMSDFISELHQVEPLANRLLVAVRQQKKQLQIKELAEQVNLLNKDLYARSMQMEAELDKTRKLQQSLLPLALEQANSKAFNPFAFTKLHFENEHLRITGLYLPCDALGGDLYDLITFQDDSLGVIVSDVSGHGVPAAFVTAMFKSVFYRITHMHQTPDQVLYHINNQLSAIVKTGDYLTAIYMRFCSQGQWVQYGGAGHPYPMVYRKSTQCVELLNENGMPLVWIPDMDYSMQQTSLQPGDVVLLYTDGITELANTQEELFGEERLAQLLKASLETPSGMCDEVLDDILMCLSNFTEGQPLNDDMTLMLVQVK